MEPCRKAGIAQAQVQQGRWVDLLLALAEAELEACKFSKTSVYLSLCPVIRNVV